MQYTNCQCRNCGRQYLVMLASEAELRQKPCPSCGGVLVKVEPGPMQGLSDLFGVGGG